MARCEMCGEPITQNELEDNQGKCDTCEYGEEEESEFPQPFGRKGLLRVGM